MNDFLRCFLNVPKNGIEDIFIFTEYNENKKEIDSRFDELYAMLRLTYNIDVKSIVSSVINNYNSNPFQQSNATIINAIIKTIDNTLRKDYLETNPIYELLNNEKYINSTNKKTIKVHSKYANNNLDMHTTIEYIICNLYQIIKSKNFTETFKFSELKNFLPNLISDNSDSPAVISNDTLNKSTRDYYFTNALYPLLLPDNTSNKKKKADNYIYCEDFEEIMIASTLKGPDNVYNKLFYNNENNEELKNDMKKYKNGAPSPRLYESFANEYNELLKSLYSKYISNSEIDINEKDYFTKENLFTKYFDFSVHSTNYISDMIFAFGLSSELSRLYEENKIYVSSPKFLAINASIIFTIPELVQREKYTLLALTELYKGNSSDSDDFDFKTIYESYMAKIIKFDADVFYPILVLVIIEYIKTLYNKKDRKEDFVVFCLEELNEIFNTLKKHELLYNFDDTDDKDNKDTNRYKTFQNLPYIYSCITNEYMNRNRRNEFDKKITSHNIDLNVFFDKYLSSYES